jgi:hypothetical protein
MRTSSCKAKGRRACAEFKEILHKYAPDLAQDDIVVTPSGVTGEDVALSPRAREKFNLAIECKNQERISIWAAIEQSKTHVRHEGSVPILAFKRNNSELMVALSAEEFIRLIS